MNLTADAPAAPRRTACHTACSTCGTADAVVHDAYTSTACLTCGHTTRERPCHPTCPDCHGTGSGTARHTACPTCHGTGQHTPARDDTPLRLLNDIRRSPHNILTPSQAERARELLIEARDTAHHDATR